MQLAWKSPCDPKTHVRSARDKVEHPFQVLKVIFGLRKVRYRGIAKNAQRLNVACALVNLFMLRRPSLRLAQATCR
jgi:IS5 family transposase